MDKQLEKYRDCINAGSSAKSSRPSRGGGKSRWPSLIFTILSSMSLTSLPRLFTFSSIILTVAIFSTPTASKRANELDRKRDLYQSPLRYYSNPLLRVSSQFPRSKSVKYRRSRPKRRKAVYTNTTYTWPTYSYRRPSFVVGIPGSRAMSGIRKNRKTHKSSNFAPNYRQLENRFNGPASASHGITMKQVQPKRQAQPKRILPNKKDPRPNIVVLMSDDQDVVFGSLDVMKRTQKWLVDEGARFNQAFVTTPICCPSRATYLTGRYMHNHGVSTNNKECYSDNWQTKEEPHTFGVKLQRSGYQTNFIGKYMNEYDGQKIPKGWDNWIGLVKNSRYYNYTLRRNFPEKNLNFPGKHCSREPCLEKHGQAVDDYFTDVISDEIEGVLQDYQEQDQGARKPLLVYANFPAPHGVEYAPKRYEDKFHGNREHREHLAYNKTGDIRKNWFLRSQKPLTEKVAEFTDLLHTRRLQTLSALDDSIDRIFQSFQKRGMMDNTYFLYASDHGYHLGHYGLAKGKSLPYEFDIKVPFMIRGPNIKPGQTVNYPVANIDLAPTVLDIANVPVPQRMDGRSIMTLLTATTRDPSRVQKPTLWRDTLLIERGKTLNTVVKTIPDRPPKLDKKIELFQMCQQDKYRNPCAPDEDAGLEKQEWYCEKTAQKQTDEGVLKYNYKMRKCSKKTHGIRRGDMCHCDECSCNRAGHQGRRVGNSCRCLRYFPTGDGKRKSSRQRKSKLVGRFHHPRRRIRMRTIRALQGMTVNLPAERPKRKKFQEIVKLTDKLNSVRKAYLTQKEANRQLKTQILKEKQVKLELSAQYQLELKKVRRLKARLRRMRKQERLLHQRTYGRKKYFKTVADFYEHICMCADPKESRPDKRKATNEMSRKSNPLTIAKGERDKRKEKLKEWQEKYGRVNKKRECDKLKDVEETRHMGKREKERRLKACGALNKCGQRGLKCSLMDQHHWRSPPYYTLEPFCYCQSASNNTYQCLRTVNATHNFMYCSFPNETIYEYYDYRNSPVNIDNQYHTLSLHAITALDKMLDHIKGCRSGDSCTIGRGGFLPAPSQERSVLVNSRRKTSYIEDMENAATLGNNDEPGTLLRSPILLPTKDLKSKSTRCGRRCRLKKQRKLCKKKKNRKLKRCRILRQKLKSGIFRRHERFRSE